MNEWVSRSALSNKYTQNEITHNKHINIGNKATTNEEWDNDRIEHYTPAQAHRVKWEKGMKKWNYFVRFCRRFEFHRRAHARAFTSVARLCQSNGLYN